MIKAVLFDLDDTLLGNQIDSFMEHYFALLGQYVAKVMDPQVFIRELLVCTRAMMLDTNTAVSNRDSFWQAFAHRNPDMDVDKLEQFFETFYREIFPELRQTTSVRPSAARLVRYCMDNGLKVIVATNPAFPRIAIEQRLAWAGVPVTEYAFDLVTTYENMHSAKPQISYYQEILENVGVAPDQALMVGDSWENDIAPAAALGMFTYWVAAETAVRPDEQISVHGQGTLAQLEAKVNRGWLTRLAN